MHPVLLRLGPFVIYSYGLLLALALAASTWLACAVARRGAVRDVPMTVEQIVDFCCLSLLGGIIGARLLFVALEWEFYLRSPQDVPAIWRGGLVWYGGFAGGVAAGWLYVRAKRLALLRVLDYMIPFLALGHALGRVGCFLNGCCYGRLTTAWYGVVFPGRPGPVIPTQLFESLGLLALFVSLRLLQRPPLLRRPGALFGVYLMAYGTLRFSLEFLRGDQRAWWLGLTLQQLVSLGAFGLGLYLLASRLRVAQPPPVASLREAAAKP